jgi:hypothetical protein
MSFIFQGKGDFKQACNQKFRALKAGRESERSLHPVGRIEVLSLSRLSGFKTMK